MYMSLRTKALALLDNNHVENKYTYLQFTQENNLALQYEKYMLMLNDVVLAP